MVGMNTISTASRAIHRLGRRLRPLGRGRGDPGRYGSESVGDVRRSVLMSGFGRPPGDVTRRRSVGGASPNVAASRHVARRLVGARQLYHGLYLPHAPQSADGPHLVAGTG